MTKTVEDEQGLIAELRTAFPRTDPRSLRAWSNKPANIGAVVCGEAEIDGLEIGPTINPNYDIDDTPYNGWVLKAFEAWCTARGWYVEVYDPGTLWVVPIWTGGAL